MSRLSYKTLFIILLFLLIPIVFLIRINQKANPASAGWWDETWSYRVAVNIGNTSGSALTNYQINISIGTSALIAAGKMQSDCDDIRITDQNGNLLPYWFSGCNTANTQIWPKIPTILTSGTSIYLYYGNASAASGKTIIGTSDYPGLSCKSIFDASNSTGNTSYWIDPTNGDTSDKFQAYCDMSNDAGGWMLVTQSMINTEVGTSVTTTKTAGTNNGLIVSNITTATGCGPSSSYKFLLNDIIPWSQIKTDYQFTGGNSCWGIFGNTSYTNSNLTPFALGTDTIRNQVKMGGSNGDSFDGVTQRCDNETYNFWHANQGTGTTRSAQILLRRNNPAALAGLGDGIGCIAPGNYGWKYQNIYIRETAMSFPATSTPQSEELSPAPIAYWKFDEGVGTTTYDSTKNRLTANFLGTGSSSPTWVTEDQCVSGKCLLFNGTNEAVIIPNNPILHPNSITFSTWIKLNQYGSDANVGYIIMDNYGTNQDYIFYISNTGKISLRPHVGTDRKSNTSIALNQWNHIVATHDGTTINFFLNGKYDGGGSSTGLVHGPGRFNIGGHGAGGWEASRLNGFIDETKVYPYARTLAQIKTDYASGLAGMGSSSDSSVNFGSSSNKSLTDGLIAYWKFDEGVNTTSADSSGKNNLATLSGSPLPGWSNGKYGIGISFNGTSYITTGQTVPSTITISTWATYSADGMMWNRASGVGPDLWFSAGNIYLNVWDGYANALCAIPSNANNGQFHHYVLINTSPTASLYYDGRLCGTALYKNPTGAFIISSGESNYGWKGNIDEVRLYNRALSQDEVKQLYNYAPDPIAYWKMDEGIGTTAYDSRGNLNAFFGPGTSAPSWTTGKYGNGLNFNGTSSYAQAYYNQSLNLGPNRKMSFSAQIKANSYSAKQVIVSRRTGCNNEAHFNIYVENNNLYLTFYSDVDSSSVIYSTTSNPLVNGQNYHIEWTKEWAVSGATKVYLNGIPQTLTITGNDAARAPTYLYEDVYIGAQKSESTCDGPPTRFFNGMIDDVKIYNYSRTQEQVLQDMQGDTSTTSHSGQPLIWYKLNEAQGTTVNNYGIGGSLYHADFGIGDSTPTWTTGKNNGGLRFDGFNDKATLNSSFYPNYDNFTLTAWFNISTGTTTAYDIPIFGSNQYTSLLGYKPATNTFQQLRQFTGNSTTISWATPYQYADSQWHYVAVSVDQGTTAASLYLDGKFISTQSIGGTEGYTHGNGSFRAIGRNYGVSMNGLLDELKVYNYALTADEVKTDYNQSSTAVFGVTNLTVGNTSFSAAYCLPGDTSPCSPPIAEWKFDEGVGSTAFDTSGNNNTTSLLNSPSWTMGKIGSAIQFNGSNQRGNAGTSISPSHITLEAWVYRTSSTIHQGIIRKQSTYAISLYNDTVQVAPGNNWAFYNTSQTIPLNTWTHLAFTYDGITMKLYKNGNFAWSQALAGSFSSNANTTWIGYDDNNWWWTGKMDQVRIYDYARSPAQIAWDYNQGKPIAHWKMDECQGSQIADWSGNNNHGTLSVGSSGTQSSPGTCTTSGSAWYNGKLGKINSSVNLDGSDDQILIGDPPSGLLDFDTGPFSYGLWIYSPSSAGGFDMPIYKGGSSNGNPGYDMELGTSAWLAYVGDNSTTYSASFGTETLNQWVHLFVVVDRQNNQLRAYKNGILTATNNISTLGSTNSTNPLYIGHNSYRFKGQIDDVRIYNYPLTLEQIKQVYNGGSITFN